MSMSVGINIGRKILRVVMFLLCCAGNIILALFSPYGPLFLISGIFLLICGVFWHALFLTTLGFWPAVIADILLIVLLFINFSREKSIEKENIQYRSELMAKERRGEPLESWEYKTIHPKTSEGIGIFDIVLGLMVWDFFISKKD